MSNGATGQLASYLAAKYGAPTNRKKTKQPHPTIAIVDQDQAANDTWTLDDHTLLRNQSTNNGSNGEDDDPEDLPVIVNLDNYSRHPHSKHARRVGLDTDTHTHSGTRPLDTHADTSSRPLDTHSDTHSREGARRRRHRSPSSSASVSPQRRRRRSKSPSPQRQRQRQRHGSKSPSPHRHRSKSPSPQRHRRRSKSPHQHSQHERQPSQSPPSLSDVQIRRMADGSGAGLQTAATVKKDIDRKRHEETQRLSSLTPALSGRNATTIYRDDSGRKIDITAETKRIALLEAQQKETELERQMEWGKGLVQTREKQLNLERLEAEKSLPLAVYADNTLINASQMTRSHWSDPMKNLLAPETKKKLHRPVYKGPPPPPNRFTVTPGFRWDGVDRSNGFERDYYKSLNSSKLLTERAYKWSSEDM